MLSTTTITKPISVVCWRPHSTIWLQNCFLWLWWRNAVPQEVPKLLAMQQIRLFRNSWANSEVTVSSLEELAVYTRNYLNITSKKISWGLHYETSFMDFGFAEDLKVNICLSAVIAMSLFVHIGLMNSTLGTYIYVIHKEDTAFKD